MNFHFIRHAVLPVLLSFFTCLSSCSGTGEKTAETEKGRNTAAAAPAESKYGALFKKNFPLPFIIDSTFISQAAAGDSLGREHILYLTSKIDAGGLNKSCDYTLQDFCRIDSIKAAGKYQEYCAGLDIGNTQASNAYALGRIKMNDSTELLLWSLVCSSYEACPFFAGSNIFISSFYRGEPVSCMNIGELSHSVDPPVGFDRTVTGKIENNSIAADVLEVNEEDMDGPEYSETREHYEFTVDKGKISELPGKRREETRKVKRKKK